MLTQEQKEEFLINIARRMKNIAALVETRAQSLVQYDVKHGDEGIVKAFYSDIGYYGQQLIKESKQALDCIEAEE